MVTILPPVLILNVPLIVVVVPGLTADATVKLLKVFVPLMVALALKAMVPAPAKKLPLFEKFPDRVNVGEPVTVRDAPD